ncbi:MAG: acetate kinase [Methylomicrobium sp.]
MTAAAKNDTILVVNCGSSSIKYRLLSMPEGSVSVDGLFERIGESGGRLKWHDQDGSERVWHVDAADHREAFHSVFATLPQSVTMAAIGHRVVHGGDRFTEPTRVEGEAIGAIRDLCSIAPLHNPVNLLGIEICRDLYPGLPQIAVFDTAFHQTMPPRAYRYAIPEQWHRDYHIRRFGFHGTSHRYVARRAAECLSKPLNELNLITLHLGNGASVAAIEKGRCVDTSMGFSPLEGLVMGTRCGDLDPAIPLHVKRIAQLSDSDIERVLNRESGLKGLCGTNDLREIIEREKSGEAVAALALELYCYRIKKYIGAYSAVLGEVDALVFTGGVGENAARVRHLACAGLARFGVALCETANEASIGESADIGQHDSPTRVLVIRTNEELQIARETWDLLTRRGNGE